MSQIRIAFVGDVMCGDSFSLLGWGTASCIDKHGTGFLPEKIRQIFKAHDMVFCNVECVLSDVGRDENSLRSLHMRGRSRTAKYLADWGVTVAHLANNHILEHGLEAARDTAANLTEAGLCVVGAGPENEFRPELTADHLTVGEMPLSIIGACFHPGRYAFCPASIEQLLMKVEAESKAGNLVVVVLHWGDELIDRPNLWQRSTAQRLAEAGAVLAIGHHAHVFQGVDAADGKLTAYSLGNFIFDSTLDITGWSAILSVTVGDAGVTDYELIPVVRESDFRPALAEGVCLESLRQEIGRRNNLATDSPKDPTRYEADYQTDVKALDDRHRRELRHYLRKHWLRYRWIFWPQILLRPIQRRLGTW